MRRLILLCGLLMGAMGARAAALPVLPGEDAGAFQKLSVTTFTVVGLSSTTYITRGSFGAHGGGTQSVFCTVETDNVRYEVDGASPTFTTGHLATAGSAFQVDGYSASKQLLFIGAGTQTATVQCTKFTGE